VALPNLPLEVSLQCSMVAGLEGKGREEPTGNFPVFRWMRPRLRESETNPRFSRRSVHLPVSALCSHSSSGVVSKCGGLRAEELSVLRESQML
jgi:hypothetical protein